MEFLSIKYSELRSGPGFSNRTFGAEVILDENEESPEQAMEKLVSWVQSRHTLEDEYNFVRESRDRLEQEIRRLELKRLALTEEVASLNKKVSDEIEIPF